jgi:hypothetical protein
MGSTHASRTRPCRLYSLAVIIPAPVLRFSFLLAPALRELNKNK